MSVTEHWSGIASRSARPRRGRYQTESGPSDHPNIGRVDSLLAMTVGKFHSCSLGNPTEQILRFSGRLCKRCATQMPSSPASVFARSYHRAPRLLASGTVCDPARSIQIDDIMTFSPPTRVTERAASLFVDHDDVLEEALDIMVQNGVTKLPVLRSDGHVVGSVTYREVLRGLRESGENQLAA
jgi:hypothetical protein